jgi:uracil-DNA glycosylase
VTNSSFKEQVALRAAFFKEQGLDYAFDRPELRAQEFKVPSSAEPVRKEMPPSRKVQPHSSPPPTPLRVQETTPPVIREGDPAQRLTAIREELGDCRRCRLCEGRSKIVFGAGDPKARLLFVGEGPGADEDRQGEPFVGRAGQLLTDIITKGMGLARAQVYIANVVKCRPPENRTPLPDEAATCMPFLEAQIAALGPEVIVALGATATQHLLGVPVQITKFRGTWSNFRGIPLMPTFHPSYILRNPPGAKAQLWKDVQQVLLRLGLPIPGKG